VDLLRGWAFYLVRSHRHGGAYEPLYVEYPAVLAIVDAINRHAAARPEDRAPEPRNYEHLELARGRDTEVNDNAAQSQMSHTPVRDRCIPQEQKSGSRCRCGGFPGSRA